MIMLTRYSEWIFNTMRYTGFRFVKIKWILVKNKCLIYLIYKFNLIIYINKYIYLILINKRCQRARSVRDTGSA